MWVLQESTECGRLCTVGNIKDFVSGLDGNFKCIDPGSKVCVGASKEVTKRPVIQALILD